MGPIDIIIAVAVDKHTIRTKYHRPDDGTLWRNLCRLRRDRVVWASIRKDGSQGRWRDHQLDSVITFQLTPRAVIMNESYDDGSKVTRTYPRHP